MAASEQERIQEWKKAAHSRLAKMFNQVQQTLTRKLSGAASFDPKKWELRSVVEAAFSAQLPSTQIKALVLLGGWLTSQKEEEGKEDVTDAIIRMGMVPRLLHFMKVEGGSSTDVHYWAAWVLESIALKHPQHLLTHNGTLLPRLLQLLSSSKSDPVQQQAIWTIGTLSLHSAQCRDTVLLANGAADAMLNYFPQFSTRTISVALSALSNLFIFNPKPPLQHLIPLLPPLQNLLDPDKDIQILSKTCYILRFFCDIKEEGAVQAVIDAGICENLVQLLLRHPSPYVGTTIAAIASKSSAAITLLLPIISTKDKRDHNWKSFLTETCRIIYHILFYRKLECLPQTCRMISNITAGNTEDLQAVIDGKIIHQLLVMVEVADLPAKKEIAAVIANVTVHGSNEQMKYLIQEGWMKPLTKLFAHSDTALAILCLQSLNNIEEFLNWK